MKKILACIVIGFSVIVDLILIPVKVFTFLWTRLYGLWSEFVIDHWYSLSPKCGRVAEKIYNESAERYGELMRPKKDILPTEES